jgi:Fur family ferric uptake transcriptional regulator
MSHYDREFSARVRERGYRVTWQREVILDAVCEAGGHTTPDEIRERVREKAPALNRATVYRNLSFLCDLGLLVAADIGNGHLAYEIAPETPHHHLVCRHCGRTVQISHEVVEPLFARVEQEHGFAVDREYLVMWGLCQQCHQPVTRV